MGIADLGERVRYLLLEHLTVTISNAEQAVVNEEDHGGIARLQTRIVDLELHD